MTDFRLATLGETNSLDAFTRICNKLPSIRVDVGGTVIVVNATLESAERDIAALKTAIADMVAHSSGEAGCLDYTFAVELGRPHVLRITECWESMDALRAHFQTPHMTVFREALQRHPPTSSIARFYEAQELPSPLG